MNSKLSFNSWHRLIVCLGASVLIFKLTAANGVADLIELANGDRYSGTVTSVNLTNVTVKSDVQGVITLPRTKVARITFGAFATGASVNGSMGAVPNPAPRIAGNFNATAKAKLGDSNAVARVQNDMLAQAGPEATRKYNELARGLMSGSLNVADLRKQAQQTLQDADALKQELGPDASEMLDGYLDILRAFINDSGAAGTKP